MPNLNPILSDQIDIDGNTFTLGATLPGTITTGEVITNITGINPGISYYFSVIAFNDLSGYSGWAGPIVVYIQPELRSSINIVPFAFPYNPIFSVFSEAEYGFTADTTIPKQIISTDAVNLFPLSNKLTRPIWNFQSGSAFPPFNNQSVELAPPDEEISVSSLVIPNSPGGNLITISRKIDNLQPGTTYTYSFYHNISGHTFEYLLFRIGHAPGLTTYIRQIEPVDQGNFALNESYSETSIRYATYPTGTSGWQRFAAQFVTNPGQTWGIFSAFAVVAVEITGGTAYFGGPQLEVGSIATKFKSTKFIANWEGLCADDSKLLSFGDSYGLTYMVPSMRPTADMQSFEGNQLGFAEGIAQNTEIARIANLLKQLPPGKRAILPVYFYTSGLFFNYADVLNLDSGITYTYNINYYDTIETSTLFPGIWPNAGVSYAKALWNSILDVFSATGATFDYLVNNAEMFGGYDSFATFPDGLTATIVTDPRYYQSYKGLTSWYDWMASEGATIANVTRDSGNIYAGYDYVVWNGIYRAHELRALNDVYEQTLIKYPNATLSEYEWSYITDGGPIDGPPDTNGHPQYWKYNFGNAAAPQLYGILGGIAGGLWGICGSNPSYIYFAPEPSTPGGLPGSPQWRLVEGDTRPPRNAWTSFAMGLQMVRSSKRATPNLPITPWIGNVKWSSNNYGTTAERPNIGFSDTVVGYNPHDGVTFTVAGGNSAYYYEMVRHLMLTGTKTLLYFNAFSFTDRSVVPDGNSTKYLLKFYNNQGATGFIKEMQLLDDTVGEVHEKTGGFTLTTADVSRISWLAPYVASGAPGPNGITWWWRITTNPGNTTFVNGQTLSVANNNIVGTWVSTTGPTLAGISITSSP
jgi:hypothetical protein